MSMEIKRGGVYYIDNPTFTGHEMAKDRPAVVVSCDAMNCTSSVVSVVYMTGSKPADTPYRVRISAARSVRHGDSTALCDHIYTVDISRVGKYMGQCSQEEMDAIDNALLMTMALCDGKYKGPEEKAAPQPCKAPQPAPYTVPGKPIALVIAETERDTYKGLYERLLDSMTMERRIGA